MSENHADSGHSVALDGKATAWAWHNKALGQWKASRAIVRYTWDVVSLMVVNSSTHQTIAILLGVKYKEWGVKKKLGGLAR